MLTQAAAAFEASGCDLAERLMRALEAGADNGEGDSRCTPNGIPSDSSFIQVERPETPKGSYLELHVRASGSQSPIPGLREQFDAWRSTHPCPMPPSGGSGGGGAGGASGGGSPNGGSAGAVGGRGGASGASSGGGSSGGGTAAGAPAGGMASAGAGGDARSGAGGEAKRETENEGCGCRTGGRAGTQSSAFALAALALLALRRRR